MHVGDSLSFVQVHVGLINVARVFLSDLDIYVLVVYRLLSCSPAQDENLLSSLGIFCIG